MSVGSRIRDRRVALGLSVDEVASKLGKNRSTVYRYESDYIENLPISILGPLSEVLETSPTYLMGWLDGEDEDVRHIGHSLRFKIINDTAAGGKPVPNDDSHVEYITFPDDIDASHCVRCKGDSMLPKYQDGDLVFIRVQPMVENGQVAAVKVPAGDGRYATTLKMVYYKPEASRLVLRPINPIYDDLVYEGDKLDGVQIVGPAVSMYRVG